MGIQGRHQPGFDSHREECDERNQYLDYPNLVKSVKVGSDIVIADGNFLLQVIDIVDDKTISAQVLNRATIGSRKNCNLPGTRLSRINRGGE